MILDLGAHHVSISTSEAFQNLTDEDKIHFVRGELQLKKVSPVNVLISVAVLIYSLSIKGWHISSDQQTICLSEPKETHFF